MVKSTTYIQFLYEWSGNMKSRLILPLICTALLFNVSCSAEKKLPVRNVYEYNEKTLEAELPVRLYIECDNCETEIYRWIRKEVKFEYTKSVTGMLSSEVLTEKLGNFNTEISNGEKGISFKSSFRGSGKLDDKLVLRIFIPKRTERFEFICKKGKLKIFDNMQGELIIRADQLDTDINSFNGRLYYDVKKGSISISGGELADGTFISTGDGNIKVKARYEPLGSYNFISKKGIMEILVPKNLTVHFTGDLPMNLETDEYSENSYLGSINGTKKGKNESDKRDAADFKLESGTDLIKIKRF